jgi:hypothetical protein
MFRDIIGAEDIIGASTLAFGGYGASDLDNAFGSNPLVIGNVPAGVNQSAVETALAARNSAMVVPRQITKAREYPLGFPTTAVAAGGTASIQTQPQVPFRGRRLIVPSYIAGSFLINDLRVGKNSMFPTSNPVPARAFTELGVGVDLNLDTAQISQLITLNVENTSGAQLEFNACLIGTAVE